MRDDALAPVVALMLILALIVTFLSVWNAVVIPSMKQSAEVEHLRSVESAFQQFSSDIEKAVSLRQDHLVFSGPVQLGGGEVMFDSVRSGGSLSVRNEPVPVYNLTLYDEAGGPVGRMNGTIVTIAYEPVSNFWQDQGYRWLYGYINVTKYGSRETPLGFYNMTDVDRETGNINNRSLALFAQSFGAVDYSLNQTLFQDVTPTPENILTFSPRPGYCSGLDLIAVNITTSPDHPFVSSNGYGTLSLTSTVNRTQYYRVAAISFGTAGGAGAFRDAIFSSWNASWSELNTTYCYNNVIFDASSSVSGFSRYRLDRSKSPVNVTFSTVEIRIGAY